MFAMPRREHVARLIRADLEAAREAWLADAGTDAEERVAREGSDFLRAENHDGRVIDFHALRHTFGSRMARSGAGLVQVQRLMGHSDPKLTLNIYTHVDVADQASAIGQLAAPPIPSVLATAEHKNDVGDAVAPGVAQTSSRTGPDMSSSDHH